MCSWDFTVPGPQSRTSGALLPSGAAGQPEARGASFKEEEKEDAMEHARELPLELV